MIRILHLEDNRKDAELLRALLAEDGLTCEIVRVESRGEFESSLNQDGFDLIISDFTLPSYDGLSALALARARCPDVPFIFFSGTIGEETAIDAVTSGATDYVLKHRPARLVSAVKRALRELQERVERKRTEEALRQTEGQLRQSLKMEAMGRLAGGVAHDFNNMLTLILGYSQIVLNALGKDNPLSQDVLEIKKAGERSAGLTRQLLAFSRRQVLQPKVLDLNGVVTNFESMLRRVIGEDVTLRTVLSPGLGCVKVDAGQMEQVIMNLVVNARDAMPNGGTLTIETANVELDEAFVLKHKPMAPGRYVMLAVSDTGCGMDYETQAHIFDPFFTTKELGKGTGLGLSTVYGIIKQSDGYIWVDSEPGQGATFKIYLPHAKEVAETVEPDAISVPRPRGVETILLVEDEKGVRAMIRHILKQEGYTVLEAGNSQEAFQHADQHKDAIHLMVTDVVMPGMGGREVAERIKSSRPDMKVLFVSGYTGDAIAHHGVLDKGVNFLEKPFTAEGLTSKVRGVLDTNS
jgi:two-component system, cell cycle sensor histidine kinase and response regulator CckA